MRINICAYCTYIAFFLLFAEIASADIIINEIMYSPSSNEWIEILNTGDSPIDLTSWKFYEASTNHGLVLMQGTNILPPGSYAVISEDAGEFLSNYPEFNSTLFDSSFSLSDSGECIALKNASTGEIIDEVCYNSLWGGDSNISLELVNSTADNSLQANWKSSLLQGGTPAQENTVAKTSNCDWYVSIFLDSQIFEKPEFKVKVTKSYGSGKANLTVDKWIEDSSSAIVKTYSLWNIEDALNYKTSSIYSPSLTAGDAYFINANITDISCIDTNLADNFISEMIFVKGTSSAGSSKESSLIITESPDSAEFGDVIKAKIDIYRGDTSKYAIYLYAEDKDGKDISEKLTLHADNKYTHYSILVPLQLDLNCNEKYDDGNYIIVLEGLDQKVTEKIKLGGKSSKCSGSSASSSSSSTNPKFEYSLESKPEYIESDKPFYIQLKITSDKEQDIDVWSYIYRGSKCYSPARDANKKTISFNAGETKTIELSDIAADIEPGDYNLKIKLLKENQKTEKEITDSIKVLSSLYQSQLANSENSASPSLSNSKTITELRKYISYSPLTVFESTSYRSLKLVPILIVAVAGLFALLLVIKQ